MERFINETGVDSLVHVPDLTGDLWARFDVRRQSTYVYINHDGTMTQTGYGSLVEDVVKLIAD